MAPPRLYSKRVILDYLRYIDSLPQEDRAFAIEDIADQWNIAPSTLRARTSIWRREYASPNYRPQRDRRKYYSLQELRALQKEHGVQYVSYLIRA